MKYQSYKGQKDVKLLYFFAIVISFALFLITYVIFQPTKEIFWKDYAATQYDATIITESDGTQKLAVDVSTPEQLAGIFTDEEKTYNLYQSSNSNAKTKIYIAKNVKLNQIKSLYETKQYLNISGITNLNNNVYRLTNNISLSGKTWTSEGFSSNKTFDGMGYEVSNITIMTRNSQKTIGFIQANYGIIKNLTVRISITSTLTCSSSSTRGYMGGICGKNYGIIKNCNVYGTLNGFKVQDNTEACVGGIAGICYGNTEPTGGSSSSSYVGLIQSCYNYATVTNGKYVGGIAGAANWNSTIKLCYNQGTVTSSLDSCDIVVGGIVGQIANSTLKQCANYSNLSVSHQSGEIWVGGITGKNSSKLEQCFNMGSITSDCSNYDIYNYAGGITGYSTSTITESCNNGEVKALSKTTTTEQKDTDNVSMYSGSILSVDRYGGGTEYKGEKVEQKAKAGGIAGFCSEKISDCYNTAKVSSQDSYYKNYYVISAYLKRDNITRTISYADLLLNYGASISETRPLRTEEEEYIEYDRLLYEYRIVYNYASHPICPSSNFERCYSQYGDTNTRSYIKSTRYYTYRNTAELHVFTGVIVFVEMWPKVGECPNISNLLNCSDEESKDLNESLSLGKSYTSEEFSSTFMIKSKNICTASYLPDLSSPEYVTGLKTNVKIDRNYLYIYSIVTTHDGDRSYSKFIQLNGSVLTYSVSWGISQSTALSNAGLIRTSGKFDGKPYPRWLFWENSNEEVSLT